MKSPRNPMRRTPSRTGSKRTRPTTFYKEEAPRLKLPGSYEVYLSATDTWLGFSAMSWVMTKTGSNVVIAKDTKASRSNSSGEQRAYVAGAVSSNEAVPAGSKLTIHSLSQYVVGGINGGADRWEKAGWKDAQHKDRPNQDAWQCFLMVRDDRKLKVRARYWPKAKNPHTKTFDLLTRRAGVAAKKKGKAQDR